MLTDSEINVILYKEPNCNKYRKKSWKRVIQILQVSRKITKKKLESETRDFFPEEVNITKKEIYAKGIKFIDINSNPKVWSKYLNA